MAKKLTENTQYVCSKWDPLKLGIDVGSVALNDYLNAVQDLNPKEIDSWSHPSTTHGNISSSTTALSSMSNNYYPANRSNTNQHHGTNHISTSTYTTRDEDRQSKLTPTQILHMIDTLRPQTCHPPHKSILHNLVRLDKKSSKRGHYPIQMVDSSSGGSGTCSDDIAFVNGNGDDLNVDVRMKDIGDCGDDGNDDSITSIASMDDDDNDNNNYDDDDDDKEEEGKEGIGSVVNICHDGDAANETDEVPCHSNNSNNIVKDVASSSSLSLQKQINSTIHTNNDHIKLQQQQQQQQSTTKLQVPWQSLIQVYEHMCHQDSLEDGKTPLQRRKTHYMEYTDVIDKLKSVENRALELKVRTDIMKRKQQDLGIVVGGGIVKAMTMDCREGFIKKKRM